MLIAVLVCGADTVIFHRSGDPRSGLHGNTALWRPSPDSHRIAIVLYQTEIKIPEGAAVGVSRQGAVQPKR